MLINSDKKASRAFSNPIFRPIFQLIITITLVFLVAVSLLVWTSWRNVDRIQPIHQHLKFLTQLQQLDTHFQDYQAQDITSSPDSRNIRSSFLTDIDLIVASNNILKASTIKKLRIMKADISKSQKIDKSVFVKYRNIIQGSVSEEIKLHNTILFDMSRNTRFEFYLSLAVALIFTVGLLLILYFFRHKILLPLNNFNGFITLLAEQEYKTMSMNNIEPLLQPLFSNYNYMVLRLSELEKEHANRREFLEQNIRNATDVLVDQQRALARSERLAILGEFVAGIAHELRNPLAGIQMALMNLRQEIESASQQQRLDLVNEELARTSRILDHVLNQAKHDPEQIVCFNMKEMVDNLVTLARYQLPPGIDINYSVPEEAAFYLPQDSLRQALLNLIINASQAINNDHGHINIKVEKLPNAVEISVLDNGPGFPDEMLNVSIQPFVTWKKNGTGLGMAMVRRFTQNLNGTLTLENTKPKGALVTLKLPC